MDDKFIDKILKEACDIYSDVDVPINDCIKQYCNDLCEIAQTKAFIDGARLAGIPLSVIRGETKLKDHFSPDYINFKCNKPKKGDSNE